MKHLLLAVAKDGTIYTVQLYKEIIIFEDVTAFEDWAPESIGTVVTREVCNMDCLKNVRVGRYIDLNSFYLGVHRSMSVKHTPPLADTIQETLLQDVTRLEQLQAAYGMEL